MTHAAAAFLARSARIAVRLIGWAMLLALLYVAVDYGVRVRGSIWTFTDSVRFTGDIHNGYHQGNRVMNIAAELAKKPKQQLTFGEFYAGYLATYERVVAQSENDRYGLDYTPTRLLVMSLWVKHLQQRDPPINEWNRDYATTAPLLRLNLICEIISALAMWALIASWRYRRDRLPSVADDARRFIATPLRALPAVLAGLAVWLNPALIWNAHAWPQWDVWLIPFFLLAILAATHNAWLAAGFLCALGASLKGQMLMVLPVLILWPLLAGRFAAAGRFVVGLGLFAALMVSPWMAHEPLARRWIVGVLVATLLAIVALRRGYIRRTEAGRARPRWFAIAATALVLLAVFSIQLRSGAGVVLPSAAALATMILLAARVLSHRTLIAAVALIATTAVFLAGQAFEGQWDWYKVGYEFPTRQYKTMAMGSLTNLPSLLRERWRWSREDPALTLPVWTTSPAVPLAIVALVMFITLSRRRARTPLNTYVRALILLLLFCLFLPWGTTPNLRTLLILIYAILLALCALGAALQGQRRDPRVIFALCTPWLLMFAVLPQMHERYLLWAAVTLSCGFGLSVGHGLLSVLVSFFAWANLVNNMLNRNEKLLPEWYALTRNMPPDAAWAVLLLAAVCVYASLAGRSGSRPVARASSP